MTHWKPPLARRAGTDPARALRVLFTLLLCSAGPGCEQVTEVVVEKGVQTAKEAAKGIEQGLDKGRKSGASVDDALVVSSAKDLEGSGSLQVRGVRPLAGSTDRSELELVFENTLDRPLRITKLDVIALDREGFVVRPAAHTAELTVEPRAKERLWIELPSPAGVISRVRVWGFDHALTLAADPAAAAEPVPPK